VGSEFVLFRNTWGDVLVATDTTLAGRDLPEVSKERPVYYKGLSLGSRLGTVPGDLEPPIKELSTFAGQILAKEGYLPAQPGKQEPDLLLILQWGHLDPRYVDIAWFLGYRPELDVAASHQIGFIGAEAFLSNFRSPEVEMIMNDARHPVYGIMITAFDFKTARTSKPTILWQTRIGLPTHGKSMARAMPVMLTAAGPMIGRPSAKPTLRDTEPARTGKVNLGDIKFIDSFEDPYRGSGVGSKMKERPGSP